MIEWLNSLPEGVAGSLGIAIGGGGVIVLGAQAVVVLWLVWRR